MIDLPVTVAVKVTVLVPLVKIPVLLNEPPRDSVLIGNTTVPVAIVISPKTVALVSRKVHPPPTPLKMSALKRTTGLYTFTD